jgi:hypothetical protein
MWVAKKKEVPNKQKPIRIVAVAPVGFAKEQGTTLP